MWDTATGRTRTTLTGKSDDPVDPVLLAPGAATAIRIYDRVVRLWGTDNGRGRAVLPGAGDHLISVVAFSPDGRTLATGGDTVQLWDPPPATRAPPSPGTATG
ncbi:hypothetical protein GA0115240_161254 [Streptomyces sp. DvalAA-14]|nr:hypothetical protein GA0115240_161254 [Streptomyces sp. DvalAA-14]